MKKIRENTNIKVLKLISLHLIILCINPKDLILVPH